MVFADSLSLNIGFGGIVRSVKPLHLETTLYYESAIKGDNWDEPATEAFTEILDVRTGHNMLLSDGCGVVLSLSPTVKLLPLLTDAQIEKLTSLLTEQDGTKERHL